MPAVFNQTPINMLDPMNWTAFANGVGSPTHSSTSWTVINATTGGVWEFTGINFGNYNADIPASGIITGITYSVNGVTLFSESPAFAELPMFIASALAGDYYGAAYYLYFGSNDVTGTSGNDYLTGFNGDDTLRGSDGDDTLVGGQGADILDGGAGFDTADYSTESRSIVVGFTNTPVLQEWDPLSSVGANDQLYSIERVIGSSFNDQLTYFDGATSITFVGGAGDDRLIGGALADVLDGGVGSDFLDGGVGADMMIGGDGSDLYVVDNSGDVTSEISASGGVDTVQSSITLTLGVNLENLILTGSAALAGAGNALNNMIVGNSGANNLAGLDGNDTIDGGGGADQMAGGNGDDIYVVDNASDVTSETSALGGIDGVFSSVSWTLSANIENLTLIGLAAITGAGNALNNVITGNSAANTLSGLDGADRLDGGLGADTLQGGLGADTFVFSTALIPGNVDTVTDFNVTADTIELSVGVFSSLALGPLSASAFRTGAAAGDADDRIIYNSSTGALYYDADGNGLDAAVQFATLAPGLVLTNSNFTVSPPGGGTTSVNTINTLPTLTDDFTLPHDTIYRGSSAVVFQGTQPGALLLNLGGIEATGGLGVMPNNSQGMFDNLGSVTVTNLVGGDAYGVNTSGTSSVSIINDGVWTVTAHADLLNHPAGTGFAYGVMYDGLDGSIVNNGEMTVTGDPLAVGIVVNNPAAVTNNGALTVVARGTPDPFGPGSAAGIRDFAFHSGVITNTGEITVIAPDSSYGIVWWGLDAPVSAPNIVNSGTITAQWALLSTQPALASVVDKIEWVLNTGTVNGMIDLYRGDDRIDNQGVINGDVYMYTGNDVIDTSLGVINGSVWMEDGDDQFVGGAGTDVVSGGDGNDVLNGGDGNDIIDGDAGGDTINGGAGFDLASYEFALSAVTVSLALQGVAQNTIGDGTDTLTSIEDLAGSAFNDVLTGNSSDNFLYGLNGNDVLTGGGGPDFLSGGAGDDVLIGGAGVDKMDGGAGNDIIYWDASDDLANVQGGADTDTLVFTSGSAPTSFSLSGHGFEAAQGQFTDTGANAWATQTDYYDASWRLLQTSVVNDDHTGATLYYDVNNSADWATTWVHTNASGQTDDTVTNFDTGATAELVTDAANAFDWITTWTHYVSAGVRDDTVTNFDDGTTAEFVLDPNNNADWTSTWSHYLSSGQRDITVTNFDDGTTAQFLLDPTNQHDWDTNWSHYDSAGHIDTNVVTYDDGTRAVLYYDHLNQFTWSTIWSFYDAQGHQIHHVTTNDDGSIVGG